MLLHKKPATGATRRRPRRMRACSSGPLGGGEGWAEKPAGKPTRRSACFRQHRMCCRKPRPPFTHLAGMDARQAPPRGALLFGYFLLGTQEKVTRSLCGRKRRRQSAQLAKSIRITMSEFTPQPTKKLLASLPPHPSPPRKGEGVIHRIHPNPRLFCNDTKSFNNSACPATRFCCAENCARCVSNKSINDEAPAS